MQCIRLKALMRDEAGSVLPLVGLCMMMMIGMAGLAMDTVRASLVQAKLSSALDAAGLAAGASVNSENIRLEAEKYLAANFANGFGAAPETLGITVNSDNTVIDLAQQAEMPTTLMKALGHDHVRVGATSQITRSNKGLELVLALDNTGSMTTATSAGTRLSDLKSAANALVNILYGDKTTVPNLWIGLVPFSQTVNIGTGRTSWMNGSQSSGAHDWGTTSWGGCVEARSSTGRDITDDPPSVQSFEAYYFPDDNNFDGDYNYNNWITRTTRNGRTTTTYNISSSRGPNLYCPQAVTPMTGSKSAILTAIDSMRATGNTHVNLGAVWAWRMLSPRWRNLWGGEMNTNQLPLNYDTPLMNKAVILMTDGDNTMTSGLYTAYGYLSQRRLGSSNASTAEAALDTRLSQVCTAMKNQHIIVYTIAFGGSTSTAIRNLLRNCATQPDYFFNSPTSADLQSAFRTIGDSLANLRVSR